MYEFALNRRIIETWRNIIQQKQIDKGEYSRVAKRLTIVAEGNIYQKED
jgi:hypothetical protein